MIVIFIFNENSFSYTPKDDAQAKNDIINDSTLHGLREIYGKMLLITLVLGTCIKMK